MMTNSERIAAYYVAIDRLDIDWVLGLFAASASYQRAEVEYRGAAEIARFFRERRKIRGRHMVERLWSTDRDSVIFVTGRFEGVGEAGDRRDIDFADVWHFGSGDLVEKRRTYLALGHAHVER